MAWVEVVLFLTLALACLILARRLWRRGKRGPAGVAVLEAVAFGAIAVAVIWH